MMSFIYIGIGGFIGSILRYAVSLFSAQYAFLFYGMPIHTLLVNVLGSFFIGLLYAYFEGRGTCGESLYLLLIVGLCGGFTTFSTFSLELFSMIRTGHYSLSTFYVLLSVILSVTMTAAGYYILHKKEILIIN